AALLLQQLTDCLHLSLLSRIQRIEHACGFLDGVSLEEIPIEEQAIIAVSLRIDEANLLRTVQEVRDLGSFQLVLVADLFSDILSPHRLDRHRVPKIDSRTLVLARAS